MTSGKTLLATAVVLLGVGCTTPDLKGNCTEYRSYPVKKTECTRPVTGPPICYEVEIQKYFCVRTDGGEEKSDDRREEYLFS